MRHSVWEVWKTLLSLPADIYRDNVGLFMPQYLISLKIVLLQVIVLMPIEDGSACQWNVYIDNHSTERGKLITVYSNWFSLTFVFHMHIPQPALPASLSQSPLIRDSAVRRNLMAVSVPCPYMPLQKSMMTAERMCTLWVLLATKTFLLHEAHAQHQWNVHINNTSWRAPVTVHSK